MNSQPLRECRECASPLGPKNKTGLCSRHRMAAIGRANRLNPQLKPCENCGKDFDRAGNYRKRFCSWSCYLEGRGDRHGENAPGWRGDDVGYWGLRERAQKEIKAQPCEVCGKPNADRHHIDRDISNNAPENIQFLCRSHHVKLHHQEGDASTVGLRGR